MKKCSLNTYPTTLTLLLLLLGNYFVNAQELTYRHYTNREGLGSSVVYDMVQDKNGYLWFSTSVGVSRFDGTTFKNFTREDGLPDNEITKLYLDKHNNIWFISFNGIPAVYHNRQIIQLKDIRGITAIVEDWVNDSIILTRTQFRDTTKLMGYYSSPNISGKWKFEKRLHRATDFADELNWKSPRASSAAPINFYFGIRDSETFFISMQSNDADTQYFFRRQNLEHNPYVDIRHFYRVTSNKKGIVFYGYDSLYYADMHKKTTICALTDPKLNFKNFININSIFCENDSLLWLCTRDEGLVLITNYLEPRRTVKKIFPNIFCTSILKDHENGYWIGTHSDGVYYLPNLDFRCIPGERKTFAKEARCLRVLDDNRIAAGFADGNILEINRSDQSTRIFEKWSSGSKNMRILDILPWPGENIIALSDMGTFLVSYKNAGKKLGNCMSAKAGYIDPRKKLFIAATAGIRAIDVNANIEKQIYWLRATCVTGDGKNLYWGTPGGVFQYDGDSTWFLTNKFPVLADVITHLQTATDSSLWVATPQGVFVVKNDKAWAIGRKQGLLSNSCRHISIDGQSAWISTDQGISRIDYQWQNGELVYVISPITELDGLNSNDVNQTAIAGDYIYTASAKGIGYFPKNYRSLRPPAPLININAIKTGNLESCRHDTVLITNAHNRMLVVLAGISYKSGKELAYEYRLKGFTNDWTSVVNNTIEITEAPYGEYILEARAIDRWGLKSIEPRQIFIINPPPFWKSTWFTISSYIFFALLIGSGFYLYSRNRHRKREANYRLLQKIQDLEILALRSQINPHFIFNCLSSIQYYIQQADIEKSNMYLFKFSLLIRKILRNSSASTITLQEEIQILELYLELEKLRLGSRMEYKLELDKELQNNTWYIHSMIIQPYIENAIKHGIAPLQDRQGELNISFKKSEEYIDCFIEDNGIGINKTMASKAMSFSDHTSMGAGITESRIHTINTMNKNKIHIHVLDKSERDMAGTGTIVRVSFPILTD